MDLLFNSRWYSLVLIYNISTYEWDRNLHIKHIRFLFHLESIRGSCQVAHTHVLINWRKVTACIPAPTACRAMEFVSDK